MSRSIQFILVGSVWTLTTVLFAAGFQTPGDTLFAAGWTLAGVLFLNCALALASAVAQSPVLRSTAFTFHLLAPLTWTMWAGTLHTEVYSFSTWGLVSLMALIGAVIVEHGLEMEFALSADEVLKAALARAAEPILYSGPVLDTGSVKIPRLY